MTSCLTQILQTEQEFASEKVDEIPSMIKLNPKQEAGQCRNIGK
jgi:hypothetical protein